MARCPWRPVGRRAGAVRLAADDRQRHAAAASTVGHRDRQIGARDGGFVLWRTRNPNIFALGTSVAGDRGLRPDADDAADHRGVGRGSDRAVPKAAAVGAEQAAKQVLRIDPLRDADARRHPAQPPGSRHAPIHQTVALLLALARPRPVSSGRVGQTVVVHANRMVYNEVDRDRRHEQADVAIRPVGAGLHRGEVVRSRQGRENRRERRAATKGISSLRPASGCPAGCAGRACSVCCGRGGAEGCERVEPIGCDAVAQFVVRGRAVQRALWWRMSGTSATRNCVLHNAGRQRSLSQSALESEVSGARKGKILKSVL